MSTHVFVLLSVFTLLLSCSKPAIEPMLSQQGDFKNIEKPVHRAFELDGFEFVESKLITDLANKLQKQGQFFMKGKNSGFVQQKWKGFVVDDTLVTYISALPNGHIYVTKGMEILAEKKEQRLATFLAHAIAHSMLGHNRNRLEAVLVSEYGGMTLANAIKKTDSRIGRHLLIIGGAAIPGMSAQPYTPSEEREADLLSMHMLHLNNYRVPQAIITWASMSATWPQTRMMDMVHPGRPERYNRMREYAATQNF